MRACRAFTLIEVMIVVAVVALLAAIAIPNALRSRTNANESSAIGNMKVLISSLEMHRSVNNIYPAGADWQTSMYGADCDAATSPTPDYGPKAFCRPMAEDVVQGYAWTYTGADAPAASYALLATPQIQGVTGSRSFFADQDGIIRHCRGQGSADQMVDDARIDESPADCE